MLVGLFVLPVIILVVRDRILRARVKPLSVAEATDPWNLVSDKFINLQARSTKDRVLMTAGTSFRPVNGPAEICFESERMRANCKVPPSAILAMLILFFIGCPILWISVLAGAEYNVATIIGCTPFAIYLIGGRSNGFSIDRQAISSVTCDGPLVTVRLSTAPLMGLKAFTFFVPADMRRQFFSDFETAMPGLLPESYRVALTQASCNIPAEQIVPPNGP